MEVLKIIIVLGLCLCWFASVMAGVEQTSLEEHNRLRKLHDVPPLKLSAALNKKATEHARRMAKKRYVFFSDDYESQSENLCKGYFNPERCVQLWYNGNYYYNYYVAQYTHNAAYFTNLIWASSTEMGYGIAKDIYGFYYVMAIYTPRAIGDFKKNVPFPLSGEGKDDSLEAAAAAGGAGGAGGGGGIGPGAAAAVGAAAVGAAAAGAAGAGLLIGAGGGDGEPFYFCNETTTASSDRLDVSNNAIVISVVFGLFKLTY